VTIDGWLCELPKLSSQKPEHKSPCGSFRQIPASNGAPRKFNFQKLEADSSVSMTKISQFLSFAFDMSSPEFSLLINGCIDRRPNGNEFECFIQILSDKRAKLSRSTSRPRNQTLSRCRSRHQTRSQISVQSIEPLLRSTNCCAIKNSTPSDRS
jgi:hypothetical protein